LIGRSKNNIKGNVEAYFVAGYKIVQTGLQKMVQTGLLKSKEAAGQIRNPT
jgi:hypothetical protein